MGFNVTVFGFILNASYKGVNMYFGLVCTYKFHMVASKDNYKGTLLTNYHAERINLAEDLAPTLSHIKDI